MIDDILQILEQVDGNSDGEIDFEEFQTMMAITASQPSKDAVKAWHENIVRKATDRDTKEETEEERFYTDSLVSSPKNCPYESTSIEDASLGETAVLA